MVILINSNVLKLHQVINVIGMEHNVKMHHVMILLMLNHHMEHMINVMII